MHFGDFPKAIVVWVGSLATAYTIVFLNAVTKGSVRIGAEGAKMVLLLVAFGALLFIVRHSKTQWGVVFGSLLVVVAASQLARNRQSDDASSVDSSVVHQASLNLGVPFACGATVCPHR